MTLKPISLFHFISILIFQSALFNSVYCQEQKLKRLELQYLEKNISDTIEKNNLKLKIANYYLFEKSYSLSSTDNYAKAEAILEKVSPDTSNNYAYYSTYAKLYFVQDRFEDCLRSLYFINKSNLSPEQFSEFEFLQIICLNHALRFNESKILLVESLKRRSLDTSGISEAFNLVLSAKYFETKKAAKKSLIPGGGLFYVKENKRAAMSIVLNTVFLGYTGYSIYSKHYFSALLTGVAQFIRFYSGGKKAAINYANKKNYNTRINCLLNIDDFCKKKYFGN